MHCALLLRSPSTASSHDQEELDIRWSEEVSFEISDLWLCPFESGRKMSWEIMRNLSFTAASIIAAFSVGMGQVALAGPIFTDFAIVGAGLNVNSDFTSDAPLATFEGAFNDGDFNASCP